MGISDTFSETDFKKLKSRHYHEKRFKKTKVLIIDEVSMLHAHQLDIVNSICKKFKEPFLPFGGLQVILCGDFFQLPPVTKYGQEARLIHQSEAWEEMSPKVCYLEEQHRQEDRQMLQILSDIRSRSCDAKTISLLESRKNKTIKSHITPTKLYTHNANVDSINNLELQKITGEAQIFQMTASGIEHLVNAVKKGCLAPEILVLKKGAVVMFVKNNFERGYVNGTLGEVIDFDMKGMPIVRTTTGKRIVAVPEKWSVEEDDAPLATITQVPLRLAWAITIHKSQGMTLDAVEMDLSKSFEYGMGYVALSRVRTLAGIKLLGINNIALAVNPKISDLDKELEKLSHDNVMEFGKMGLAEKKAEQLAFADKFE
jgi:ATP-dependent exoDNAse (exonuclease V) alpha subunit